MAKYLKKAKQRLEARISGYEESAKSSANTGGYHKPGSLKTKRA